jgi:hypothetical protein
MWLQQHEGWERCQNRSIELQHLSESVIILLPKSSTRVRFSGVAEGRICNWLIYNHFEQLDPTADMVRLRIVG